jgi:hypothetical protein
LSWSGLDPDDRRPAPLLSPNIHLPAPMLWTRGIGSNKIHDVLQASPFSSKWLVFANKSSRERGTGDAERAASIGPHAVMDATFPDPNSVVGSLKLQGSKPPEDFPPIGVAQRQMIRHLPLSLDVYLG